MTGSYSRRSRYTTRRFSECVALMVAASGPCYEPNEMGGKTILCAAKLHANQLERHLELFQYLPQVEKVLVVRHEPLSQRLAKVAHVPCLAPNRFGHAFNMGRAVHGVLKERAVDWVVGFNPVPWGSVAFATARLLGVPTCLSLIGMDYLQVQKWWGSPFRLAVTNADAVTVTGKSMADGLIRLGVKQDRIRVLPHSVDLQRFRPSPDRGPFDIVCVGQLIRRKRIDSLIDAVGLCAERGENFRVGILGQGPLESDLRKRAMDRGVAHLVEFLGYRDDVEEVLAGARVFALVSEWEGVPFALMEAMACGLVPVVTDVGTIADWVRDGENGSIVPVGDARALAAALSELLNETDENDRRRGAVLKERERLGFAHGAQVWKEILSA